MLHLLLIYPFIDILLGVLDNIIKPKLIPSTEYSHLHLIIHGHDKAIEHPHAIWLNPSIDGQFVVSVLVHPLFARAIHIKVLVVVLAAYDVKVWTYSQNMLDVLPFDQVQLFLIVGLISRDFHGEVVELAITENHLAEVL